MLRTGSAAYAKKLRQAREVLLGMTLAEINFLFTVGGFNPSLKSGEGSF